MPEICRKHRHPTSTKRITYYNISYVSDVLFCSNVIANCVSLCFVYFYSVIILYIYTNGSNIGYYPFYQTKIRTNLITKNLSTFTWSNCVKGRLPEQLIVCMVKHASYVGSWKNNPYAFEPFDLNNIFLRINGSPYPVKSYNPDFTAGAFVILVKTCAICLCFLKLSYAL